MSVEAKICGINTPEAMAAAVAGGADYVGLIFYPPSPRYVTPEKAGRIAATVPERVGKVGLLVDAEDAAIEAILAAAPLDLLQLHGKESAERVGEIRARFGLPVMKAIRIAGEADVQGAEAYSGAADRLLFDAKPPKDMKGVLPGGNALAFDWQLLAGRDWALPWMLSGGLDAGNLGEAVRISGAKAVDVSSGVEDKPGVKNPEKIRAFLKTAKAL
ncbi:MAG: phosphoribosylanthranilate isomerase [Kiloniellaceae bacterium]